MTQICYVDESGNDQILDLARSDPPPIFALVGLIVHQSRLTQLVWDFLRLKQRFLITKKHPRQTGLLSELIRIEIKGADLRSDIRSDSRRRRRRAFGILDEILTVVERAEVTLAGSIWVKEDNRALPKDAYAHSVALLTSAFESRLTKASDNGLMVLDAQTKVKNVPSVQAITTRKLRKGGDRFPHLLEAPVFGHSDAHVVLQVCDILASALVFPLACHAFCADLEGNVHPHPRYAEIGQRYANRIQMMEHRWRSKSGHTSGGFVLHNRRNDMKAHDLFASTTHQPGTSSSAPDRSAGVDDLGA